MSMPTPEISARSMRVRAYAKVNLCLSVGPPEPTSGPRAGFHPIASWFHGIDLFDEIVISPRQHSSHSATRGDVSLAISWDAGAQRPSPIDWPAEKDLCVRALRALEARAGRSLSATIEQIKRIPVGGGLGGGSSDAAATLRGLNALFALGLDRAALRAVGETIGSDIAFFLDQPDPVPMPPQPAIVSGFGECIEQLSRVTGDLVLIMPPFGCPTGAVYKAFDRLAPGAWSMAEQMERIRSIHARAVREGVDGRVLFNDLTSGAIAAEPRMGALLQSVAEASGGAVTMSGSGSTVFVACEAGAGDRVAAQARDAIAHDNVPVRAGAVVLVTRLV
jgi:4-diphosphocytidyl-2-C-methyl-D-erythritol kinase